MKKLHPKLSRNLLKNKYFLICIILLITIPLTLKLLSPKSAPASNTPDTFSLPLLQTNSVIPSTPAPQNNAELIDAVKSLMELPEDEEPIIATVTDPSALQDQTFFKKSQVGDKVLVYKNNGLAIIYRPTTYKIVATTTDAQIQTDQEGIPASSSADVAGTASSSASEPLTNGNE